VLGDDVMLCDALDYHHHHHYHHRLHHHHHHPHTHHHHTHLIIVSIGTEGVKKISVSIKKLVNLKTLSLCFCELTAAGAYIVAK